MLLKSNIQNLLIFIIGILIFIFFKNIKFIPLIYILLLTYLEILFFRIAFEYQRIILILTRIAKLNGSLIKIPEIQILLTNDFFAKLFFFLNTPLSGFVLGYFVVTIPLKFFIFFILIKYLITFFLPIYIPYKYLFKLINLELNKKTTTNVIEILEKKRIKKIFEKMPNDSTYEDWAFKIYGNDLLRIK